MFRLFICIWLPNEVAKELIKLKKELEKTDIKGKFVEEENIHITISFLGNVNSDKLNEVKMKMNESVKDMDEFHVNLGYLRLIPNENYIRVIGINANSEEIRKLIRVVGDKVGGKFHEETKITLCRVKNIPDKKLLKEFIEKNRNVNIGSFHVKEISLVKSVLTKSGPKYETIHKTGLRKK